MLRCVSGKTCLRACRRLHAPTGHPRLTDAHVLPRPLARHASVQSEAINERISHLQRLPHAYAAARRLQLPISGDQPRPDAWADLLEGGLPPHLRDHERPRADLTPNAADVAEILLAAQRVTQPRDGIDLLFYLGFQKDRWDAVSWLIKLLVEAFGSQVLKPPRLNHVVGRWTSSFSLEAMTGTKGLFQDIYDPEAKLIASSPGQATLDQLTDEKPDNLSREALLAHNALGQVWRSLGHMVMACADTEMKPEILEIIAYLHHMGIMPASIYNQKPSSDATSIQQPPTLNLLSSRILISLSDAAWRAHEKSNMKVAQPQTGWHQSYRLNQPGSRYRVNVAGLRSEVWVELLLWACLHGGWILEGTELLRGLHGSGWKPFSWRSIISNTDGSHPDWDKLEYAFNTRLQSAMDRPDTGVDVSVHKTISSEVINAYVDALANSTRLGVGERGLSPGYVIAQLRMLQELLERGKLSLVAGSWDAILLRLADLHDHLLNQSLAGFKPFATLAPIMGAELGSPLGRDIPEYVFDGSAAVIGLYHRALRARVNAGDVTGSFQLFQSLQDMADVNKRRSLEDFIKQQKQRVLYKEKNPAKSELFTSNFSGIAYPAFEMQIPPTVLGPFLDLAIDAEAFQFASWLVYSKEVDGPVIPERLYADPALTPALIRFASEVEDKPLLSKVLDACKLLVKDERTFLPQHFLRTFFSSQVQRRSWKSAAKMLKHMQDTGIPQPHLNVVNMAYVTRAILLEYRTASQSSNEKAQRDFSTARDLFTSAIQATNRRKWSDVFHDEVDMLLIVLSHADTYWADFCKGFLPQKAYHTFKLPTKAFNLLLEGILRAYGTARGRMVVDAFWPNAVKNAQQAGRRSSGSDVGQVQMSRFEPLGVREDANRNIILIPSHPPNERVVYGGLRPDLATIRLVIRSALDEATSTQAQDAAPSNGWPAEKGEEMQHLDSVQIGHEVEDGEPDQSLFAAVDWAVDKLRAMGKAEYDILQELRATLSREDIARILAHSPDMLNVEGTAYMKS